MRRNIKQRVNKRRRQFREVQIMRKSVHKADLIDLFIFSGEFEKALKDFAVKDEKEVEA